MGHTLKLNGDNYYEVQKQGLEKVGSRTLTMLIKSTEVDR